MPEPIEWFLLLLAMAIGLAIPILLVVSIARWLLATPRRESIDDARHWPAAADADESDEDDEDAWDASAGSADPVAAAWRDEAESADAPEADPDAPPPNVRIPAPDEKMMELLATPSRMEADFLRALLLDRGIWCFISGNRNALGALGLAEVTLHVPAGDFLRAREIISEAAGEARDQQAAEGRLICPGCGYDLRATPERCPECGLNLA